MPFSNFTLLRSIFFLIQPSSSFLGKRTRPAKKDDFWCRPCCWCFVYTRGMRVCVPLSIAHLAVSSRASTARSVTEIVCRKHQITRFVETTFSRMVWHSPKCYQDHRESFIDEWKRGSKSNIGACLRRDARRIRAMIDLRRSFVRRGTVNAFSHFAQVFVSDANVYIHVYLNKIIKSRVIQCVMAYKDVARTQYDISSPWKWQWKNHCDILAKPFKRIHWQHKLAATKKWAA